jgi:hypothetical protein
MVLAYSIFYFFLVIFQCSPVSFFWGQYEGMKGTCINPAIVPDASIAHSVVNFIADWVLGLLPIALIYNLQMNTRTKVSVAAILSLGLLFVTIPPLTLHIFLTTHRAGIATMIRIPYIKVLSLTQDFLFATTDVAIWSAIEPGLGIVAAAAATLHPLFRTFYSLTTRGSQQKSVHASRAGYLQQSSNHNFSSLPKSRSASASSLSDDTELQQKTHTVTTSVGGKGSREDKGGIQVQRTVKITRSENEDGVSVLSAEEPWPRGKDERDMVRHSTCNFLFWEFKGGTDNGTARRSWKRTSLKALVKGGEIENGKGDRLESRISGFRGKFPDPRTISKSSILTP